MATITWHGHGCFTLVTDDGTRILFDPFLTENPLADVGPDEVGDLDYIMAQGIEPTFWMATEKTPVGQLHPGIVETPFGFHIIKVEDKQPAQQVPLAQAKDQVRTFLEQEKMQTAMQQWAAQRKDTAKIEIEPKYQPKPQQAMGQPQAEAGNQ